MPPTQHMNAPPSHIILTPCQPMPFNAFGMARSRVRTRNIPTARRTLWQFGQSSSCFLRRNWSCSTFQHYIGYLGHYIHTLCMYRGTKWETEIGYREMWNSTTVTLVLVRAWSTAPIHGIAILRPHPSPSVGRWWIRWIYTMKRWIMWEPAPGIEPGSSAWKARHVTTRPLQLPFVL